MENEGCKKEKVKLSFRRRSLPSRGVGQVGITRKLCVKRSLEFRHEFHLKRLQWLALSPYYGDSVPQTSA